MTSAVTPLEVCFAAWPTAAKPLRVLSGPVHPLVGVWDHTTLNIYLHRRFTVACLTSALIAEFCNLCESASHYLEQYSNSTP